MLSRIQLETARKYIEDRHAGNDGSEDGSDILTTIFISVCTIGPLLV